MLKCRFISTETVGLFNRDGHLDFHTAPELCLQLIGWMLLYVHRNRRLIKGGHLDFHTAPELCRPVVVVVVVVVVVEVLLYVQRNRRL